MFTYKYQYKSYSKRNNKENQDLLYIKSTRTNGGKTFLRFTVSLINLDSTFSHICYKGKRLIASTMDHDFSISSLNSLDD